MVSLHELQQEAELRRKMDKSPPKYTKGCILIGIIALAVLAYGGWMVHDMHQSTNEFSRKLKAGQTPTGDNIVSSSMGKDPPAIPEMDSHLRDILIGVERANGGWFNKEKRGDTLVFSDSICWNMKKPTESTDVKSYPGIRVEEMTQLLLMYPKIAEGYKIVIVHVGTNNLAYYNEQDQVVLNEKFPPKELHIKYMELCHKIQALSPNCTIISSAILPRPRDHRLTYPRIAEFNTMLSTTFGRYFIQSGQGFADLSTPEAHFTKNYFDIDGLHLTVTGRDVLSDKFGQILNSNKPTAGQAG